MEGSVPRYLITGIAGFIGSSLAHALTARGEEVRGIDNLSTGNIDNLRDIRESVEFHIGDITEMEDLRPLMNGVDFVLHQAALASVPRSIEDPLSTHATNVNGTLNVLLAARDAGVKRVVFAASSSAYGDQGAQPKSETMMPNPLSPYAVQKLTGEQYMQVFWKNYGLQTVCLRYFNVFGPCQSADSPYSGVIARFIQGMLDGKTPTIFGDGKQSRDFTYIDNAVSANLLACSAPAERISGGVFNVGTAKSHTLNQTYSAIADILSFRKEPRYAEQRVGDIRHSEALIGRSRECLGYTPVAGFEEGLRKTVAWYEEREKEYAGATARDAAVRSFR